MTTLRPGDVVGHRGATGRWYLLAVRAVRVRGDGRFPIVDLLDHDGTDVPDQAGLQALTTRPAGDPAAGDAWWVVGGTVRHRPGTRGPGCGRPWRRSTGCTWAASPRTRPTCPDR